MEPMQLYETIFIIHPELNEEDVEEHIKRVENLVTRLGGEIIKTERWGKKRLAYEVNKHRYGFYVLLRLRGSSAFLPELERHYRLTEGIIKSLVIRLKAEPKDEPVMVTHDGAPGEEEERSLREDEEDEEGR
jgi:small subunit ribosomal protein S6